MRALASFQDLYVGLEPYKNNDQLFGGVAESTAPAVFGLLAAIELHPENKKAGGKICRGSFELAHETHRSHFVDNSNSLCSRGWFSGCVGIV